MYLPCFNTKEHLFPLQYDLKQQNEINTNDAKTNPALHARSQVALGLPVA
jgi:hypothetical protein